MSDFWEKLLGIEESSVRPGEQMAANCPLERSCNVLAPWQRTVTPPILWIMEDTLRESDFFLSLLLSYPPLLFWL